MKLINSSYVGSAENLTSVCVLYYLESIGKSYVSKNGKHVQEAACSPTGSNLHKTVYTGSNLHTTVYTGSTFRTTGYTGSGGAFWGHWSKRPPQYITHSHNTARFAFSGTEIEKENENILDNWFGPSKKRIYKGRWWNKNNNLICFNPYLKERQF